MATSLVKYLTAENAEKALDVAKSPAGRIALRKLRGSNRGLLGDMTERILSKDTMNQLISQGITDSTLEGLLQTFDEKQINEILTDHPMCLTLMNQAGAEGQMTWESFKRCLIGPKKTKKIKKKKRKKKKKKKEEEEEESQVVDAFFIETQAMKGF